MSFLQIFFKKFQIKLQASVTVIAFSLIVDSLDIWNSSNGNVTIGYEYRTDVTSMVLGTFNLSVYSFDNPESPHIKSHRIMMSKVPGAQSLYSPLTKKRNSFHYIRYSCYGHNESQGIKFMVGYLLLIICFTLFTLIRF